ncbi:hypothetical protein PR048_033723 [Dryococelus australis]|uniref:Uncharacterized protein n=1 Tax=Dryococelus australis TaxID=614101 RepID=A0ABQ9G136_9NEOP|nr:hypothetical protein PR048_033723 [Dryococelus australis]
MCKIHDIHNAKYCRDVATVQFCAGSLRSSPGESRKYVIAEFVFSPLPTLNICLGSAVHVLHCSSISLFLSYCCVQQWRRNEKTLRGNLNIAGTFQIPSEPWMESM